MVKSLRKSLIIIYFIYLYKLTIELPKAIYNFITIPTQLNHRGWLSMNDLKTMALQVYRSLFNNKNSVEIDGEIYHLSTTSKSGLRFFHIGDYKFIEQNPQKASRWGKLAREGSQILWVMKGFKFIANVQDGVFHDFQKERK